MAVTYRDMINRVLRVLSEDEIAGSTTELTEQYVKLIGTFVNHIKEEVEDATNWRVLRQFVTVTLPAGETSVALTGTNNRSRLYREYDELSGIQRPVIVDTTTEDQELNLREIDTARLLYKELISPVSNVPNAYEFAIDDSSADDELLLRVYPAANNDREITLVMIIPQDRLSDTDLDTAIKVPALPIEMGTIWYALEERGEELGVNGVFTEQRFRTALDSAIGKDEAAQGGFQLVPV